MYELNFCQFMVGCFVCCNLSVTMEIQLIKCESLCEWIIFPLHYEATASKATFLRKIKMPMPLSFLWFFGIDIRMYVYGFKLRLKLFLFFFFFTLFFSTSIFILFSIVFLFNSFVYVFFICIFFAFRLNLMDWEHILRMYFPYFFFFFITEWNFKAWKNQISTQNIFFPFEMNLSHKIGGENFYFATTTTKFNCWW